MFPDPSVTPPTFTQYPSLSFQGITFGPSPFFLRGDSGQGLQGFFMPATRTGDTPGARYPGQYVGLDLPDGRDLMFDLDVGPPFGTYLDLATAMDQLRWIFSPQGTTEIPLFAQLSADSPMLTSLVRVRKFEPSVDLAYVNGSLAQGVGIMFHATDPNWYSTPTQTATVNVPAPLGGFTFPLAFDFSFGGGSSFSSITATNYGNQPCYPVAVFTGPMTFPTLANTTLAGSPQIQFGMTLNAGDTLTVNFDPKYPSAQYLAAGTVAPADRMYTIAPGSQWWAVVPGTNNITFSTLDSSPVAGTATLEWCSAYSTIS